MGEISHSYRFTLRINRLSTTLSCDEEDSVPYRLLDRQGLRTNAFVFVRVDNPHLRRMEITCSSRPSHRQPIAHFVLRGRFFSETQGEPFALVLRGRDLPNLFSTRDSDFRSKLPAEIVSDLVEARLEGNKFILAFRQKHESLGDRLSGKWGTMPDDLFKILPVVTVVGGLTYSAA
eukprot:m.106301 g.106301  ORF g.106301 m.106301 type:complete len:176 (+) comp8943_c0_seq2:159-686(+)